MSRNIMPEKASSALGLPLPSSNTAGRMVHPLDGANFIKAQEQEDMKLALKSQGRAFAMGLRMERLMIEKKPQMPGRQFKSLGLEILNDRHGEIGVHDYLGETEGSETFTTFAYPIV